MITIAAIFLAHLGCALSLILACTPVSGDEFLRLAENSSMTVALLIHDGIC
jgi:hypothetical protein